MSRSVDHAAAARALDGKPPLDVLRWAAANLGRVAFATGFGAEGCVVIDLIGRHSLQIEIFTLDTGLLFAESHDVWRALELRYGITIRGVAPATSVEEQTALHGPSLWERDPDRCCELRKVAPLRDALRGYDAWITAIRRDQTHQRADARVVELDAAFGLVKVNPLAGWTHDDVWAHLDAHDVPRNVLHARGYPSIGCHPCTSPVVPGEHLRAGRWRGARKLECGLHIKNRA